MNLELKPDRIRSIIRGHHKVNLEDFDFVRAAVLIPVFFAGGLPYLLYTVRSQTVTHHKGEISFPGGVRHDGDTSLLQTALRETSEEIGLKESDIEVVGEMDDTYTLSSRFAISPYVGFIPPDYKFQVSADEICELLPVPLPSLLEKASFHADFAVIGSIVVPSYTYEVKGKVIWGATASITRQFLQLLAGGAEPEG